MDTFGSSQVSEPAIMNALSKVFDARPAAIIDQLDLRRPIYKATSSYGHFGRDEFPWEQTDRMQALQAKV